jgi:DNA-binding GntR family transcriptional regulator
MPETTTLKARAYANINMLLTQIFSPGFKRRKIQDLKLTLQEHGAIINAICAHNSAAAGATMTTHIQRGRGQALKRFDAARPDPSA